MVGAEGVEKVPAIDLVLQAGLEELEVAVSVEQLT